MRALRARHASRRRHTWPVWLALLVLPLAQALAGWHAYAHVATFDDAAHAAAAANDFSTGDSDDGQGSSGTSGLHHTHCALCLIGAALGGSAPAHDRPVLPQADGRHERPLSSIASSAPAAAFEAYSSRAPPTLRT